MALDQFDRDFAIEFRIARQINLAHPAFGNELDDFVAFEILALGQRLAASIQRFRGNQRPIQEAIIFSRLKVPQERPDLVEHAVVREETVADFRLGEKSLSVARRQIDRLGKEFID